MENTFFAKPMNDDVEGLAEQFIYNDSTGEITPMESSCCYQLSEAYESGGAGLISCTKDYSLLGECLANGGISKEGIRILKAETIEKIKEDTERDHYLSAQQAVEYGLIDKVILPNNEGKKSE